MLPNLTHLFAAVGICILSSDATRLTLQHDDATTNDAALNTRTRSGSRRRSGSDDYYDDATTTQRLSGSDDDDAALNTKTRGAHTYKVLQYNICWGCMEGDAADATGMNGQLRDECLKRTGEPGVGGQNGMGLTRTKCASNMGKAIAKHYIEQNGYDFMAFQEASNFGDLLLKENGIKMAKIQYGANLSFAHWQGIHDGERKQAWIVTLYNRKRLGKYDEAVASELTHAADRPFMILIFDKKQLMFVNVHNCQPGRDTSMLKCKSWNTFTDDLAKALKEHFQANPDRKEYRVIVAGDFNDLHGKLPGCVSLPWSGAVLKLARPMAKTCCESTLGRDVNHAGDYIFDSMSVASNNVPLGYNNRLAQSDHWPVEAVLNPTNLDGISGFGQCDSRGGGSGGRRSSGQNLGGSMKRNSPRGVLQRRGSQRRGSQRRSRGKGKGRR